MIKTIYLIKYSKKIKKCNNMNNGINTSMEKSMIICRYYILWGVIKVGGEILWNVFLMLK